MTLLKIILFLLLFIIIMQIAKCFRFFKQITLKMKKNPLIPYFANLIFKIVIPFVSIFLCFYTLNGAVTLSLKNTISTLKLDFDFFELNQSELFKSNHQKILFLIDVYLSLAIFYISIISLFLTPFFNYMHIFFIKLFYREYDIVFGTKHVYDYVKFSKNTVICYVANNTNKEELKRLNQNGIFYLKRNIDAEYLAYDFNLKKSKSIFIRNKIINVIVFDDFTEKTTLLCEYVKAISNFYTKNSNSRNKIMLYYEAETDNMVSIREKIIGPYSDDEKKHLRNHLSFFSSHDMLAKKFVFDNPITKDMPNGFINKDTPTIELNKKINTIILGYGKVGRNIYANSIENNHIPSLINDDGNNKLVSHTINYYIFDFKTLNYDDKNELFYMNRINSFKKKYNKDDYFEFPEIDWLTKKYNVNINDTKTINKINNIINCGNKNTYTSIIVSLGSDVENIDYALKLSMMLKENSPIKNYHIYVRVKRINNTLKGLVNDDFTFFGADEDFYNHNTIVNDSLFKIAHILNDEYDNKANIKLKDGYFTKDLIKRDSNVAASLNLTLKLNLCGFDKEINEGKTNDRIVEKLETIFLNESNKDYDYYTFFKNTKIIPTTPQIISFQEHLRWNAFYIINGYVLLPKKEIKILNGKIIKDDCKKRTHACLTTYEGLDDYHNYVVNKIYKGKDKEQFKQYFIKALGDNFTTNDALKYFDTYKYDYNLIDSITKITNYYKIIEK